MNENSQSDECVNVSPPLQLDDVISFFSLQNDRKRFYLPSTSNNVGGIAVSKLLCDTGCSSILLPTDDSTLTQLYDMYPSDASAHGKYLWSLGKSNGVGAVSSVLLIEVDPSDAVFELKLMTDIAVCKDSTRMLKRLRFFLGGDDIRQILNTPTLRANFQDYDINILNSQVESAVPRRSHGLLGQDVLGLFSCVRHGRLCLYINAAKYNQLSFTFRNIKLYQNKLKHEIQLPEHFQEWEDVFDEADDDFDDSIHDDDFFE